LKRKRGAALDDFALLAEGLLYGLLEPETYDLGLYDLDFESDEDRYLTVLKFRSAAGAQETIAGSFSSDTLVCPAGNWKEKNELEDRVQELRFQSGPNARALLRSFLADLPAAGMLWHSALEWVIEEYQAMREEPATNQRSIGPLYLRLSPRAKPRLVFFPQHRPGYLPLLVQCLNADNYVPARDAVHLEHHGRKLVSINMKKLDSRPKLLGMGSIAVREPDPHHLPAQTRLEGRAEKEYLQAVRPVANLYAVEVENPARKFTIPDALRAAFYIWGEAAIQKLLSTVQWVYGPLTQRANLEPKPHQIATREGLYADAENMFYVCRTLQGKIAYYVERHRAADLGELSGLGYALWRVFSGARWDAEKEQATDGDGTACLAIQDGWLGAPAASRPQPPDLDVEIARWSTFLAVTNRAEEGLFKTAAQTYIDNCGAEDVPARDRTGFSALHIGGWQWWQCDAM
jgi:hypothetical protein